MNTVNIDQFWLVSNFSRTDSKGEGSCIFVRNFIQTKEVNYLNGIGTEKVFELSVTELLDFSLIIVCICRSLDRDFSDSLLKLDLVIGRVHTKNKCLIFCGDWNINLLHHCEKL
jgi:hypothetical protein